MRKIPTVLRRDLDNPRFVLPEVTPGCEWVFAGEGIATRKYDGTCVHVDGNGRWWARREVKAGKQAPEGFIGIDHDEITGKTVGWEPAEQSGFWKVLEPLTAYDYTPDTYELIGPKVNGNPEQATHHMLVRHEAADRMPWLDHPDVHDVLTHVQGLVGLEGVVWHHPDGRMAKLKAKDCYEKED